MESTPFYDTAGSVKMVMEENGPDAAAIGSEVAASIYGGSILRRSIEDDRRNLHPVFSIECRPARASTTRARKALENVAGLHHP